MTEQAPQGRRTSQQGELLCAKPLALQRTAGSVSSSSREEMAEQQEAGSEKRCLWPQCNAMEPRFRPTAKALPTTWAPRWRESTEPHEAAGSQPASTSLSSLLTQL